MMPCHEIVGQAIVFRGLSSRAKLGRKQESGYALLLVLSFAAIVAIGLYTQLPRAAFEAQREKEALLIDHGEQYKRGVQLYCRKLGRYPAKMEDLDNTQNVRFLRKHYFDPMTGKEEWRLLHMGPAGKLIDSKIETTNTQGDQWHQGSITEFKSPASTDDGGPEAINLGARRRPSDDVPMAPMGGGHAAPQSTDPAPLPMGSNTVANGAAPNPNAPPNPNGTPGPNGAPPQVAGMPGMPPNVRGTTPPNTNTGANNPNANAGSSSVTGNGGFGSSVSGNGGYGAPVNSQTGGVSATPYPTGPGSNQTNPAANQFGQNTGNTPNGFGQPNPAQMINNLLTSPRPGGAPVGLPGSVNGMGGAVVGGLAGVASTHKGHGIKEYNDQDEYQKWEFFYDFAADMARNRMSTPIQSQTPNTNTNGFGATPNPGFGPTPSPGFGGTPNPGFGSQPTTGPGAPTNLNIPMGSGLSK